MPYLDDPSIWAWSLGIVQFAGLISAWLTRLGEDSTRQAWCRAVFVGCLAVIGLATMFFVALGTHSWLAPGVTLAVMILAAVWDFRPHDRVRSLQRLH
ncbi:MAG: hypothetical protein DWQ37_03995 [Planctomycetota bacterium]|nr:MAG: hypothetical protein DWQ37_03995 [Planctomycetota bacterium]